MTVLLTLISLALVVAVLARGFRVPDDATAQAERELEEAKLAKYRELRELELDWRTGKLTDADYHQIRSQLRQEAVELLEHAPPNSEATASANGGPA